jgi:hypothetical protein
VRIELPEGVQAPGDIVLAYSRPLIAVGQAPAFVTADGQVHPL